MLSDTMMLGGGRTAAFSIKNSLLFRGGQYLSRTPGVAGDQQKWTLSVWVKRASLTSQQIVFASGGVDVNRDWLAFGAGATDYLTFKLNEGSDCILDTQALSRDVSGMYHIVVAADYSQETASNRVKLYVNGVRVTSFSSENYPNQHYLGKVNGIYAHAIGRLDGGSYFNGYLAAPVLVDGAALPASSFGETDPVTLSWRPKRVSLTGSLLVVSQIAQGTGTTFGNMTGAAGLAGLFDGSLSTQSTVSGVTSAYAGKTLGVPHRVAYATAYSAFTGSDQFATHNSSMTIELRAKNGAAPSSGTDGTLLASETFTDGAGAQNSKTLVRCRNGPCARR